MPLRLKKNIIPQVFVDLVTLCLLEDFSMILDWWFLCCFHRNEKRLFCLYI